MDVWQIVILLIAAYVAIVSLMRLMSDRRIALIRDMRKQIEAERQRREEEKRRARRKERKRLAQKAGQ